MSNATRPIARGESFRGMNGPRDGVICSNQSIRIGPYSAEQFDLRAHAAAEMVNVQQVGAMQRANSRVSLNRQKR